MNILIKIWNFLSGRKTYIAMFLLFIYGGLSFIGTELVWLKDLALLLGGIGLAHGVFKGIKK